MSSITVWHIEERIRAIADGPGRSPRDDANRARVLLLSLEGAPFVRPGDTLDSILDAYLDIRYRAVAAP